MAAEAIIFAVLHSKAVGLHVPKSDAGQLPLSNSAVFQTDTGAAYQCPALIRKRIPELADLLQDGRVLLHSLLLYCSHVWFLAPLAVAH